MKLLKFSAFLILALATLSVDAQELNFTKGQRSTADINRDVLSKGAEIVELVGIKPGMVVGDVFGGGGYYAELLSEKVGSSGQVYLHNNQAYMPYVEKELVARLANNRLANVTRWDREADNLAFKPASLDAIFFVLGYHDLYHTTKDWSIDKDNFLQQLSSALKTGGKLLIVDHSALNGSKTEASQELHRIDVNYVKQELAAKGFKLVKESDLLANPKDSRTVSPFKKEMRRKTDRFILVFEKI